MNLAGNNDAIGSGIYISDAAAIPVIHEPGRAGAVSMIVESRAESIRIKKFDTADSGGKRNGICSTG